MLEIPHIDINPLFHAADPHIDDEIGKACRDIGFLSISETPCSADLIDAMRAVIKTTFAIDDHRKWDQAVTRENYRGYIPFGFFTPNDGSGTIDKYEGYKLHYETDPNDPVVSECPLYGPNVWPLEVPELKDVVLAYWAEMDRIAGVLMGALARHLNLADDTFIKLFSKPMSNMTLLHYPPQGEQEPGYGIHPHKDTDALTIIAPDSVGGLEVQTLSGDWIAATAPKGGFVVNIGDMLELWSGGQLVSTPHRVINKSGLERFSFPYFAVPNHNITVAPLTRCIDGFDRPDVRVGHWSAEVWRTNWPDESAKPDTPELGTLRD